MTPAEWAAWAQAAAGMLTFGAAAWAVLAAFRAPKLAARFAEELRQDNATREGNQRAKLWILEQLLRCRGQPQRQEYVDALNLIDFVFINDEDVREAYHQLWSALDGAVPATLRAERNRKLIAEIVRHLGLNTSLRAQDIERSYVPRFISRQWDVQWAETDIRWRSYYNEDGTEKVALAHDQTSTRDS
jgi:hypothetical protein